MSTYFKHSELQYLIVCYINEFLACTSVCT